MRRLIKIMRNQVAHWYPADTRFAGMLNNMLSLIQDCCCNILDYRLITEDPDPIIDYGFITDPVIETENWGSILVQGRGECQH